MTRTLVVWGTSSHAGKSWLVTALCRIAAQRGLRVAPFKAQNMSNNARVVTRPDGEVGEIGTAQYFQALAARAVPTTDMNPVLLKPERDTASQVVVHGRADAALSCMPWRERSALLAVQAQQAFERLAAAHELIVIEGAGSPAEINLAPEDYVNLGAARWACAHGPTAALLVADIDRGGAFAHLQGTWTLLPDDLRGLVQGFVLNRFRGDAALLAPGPQMLERHTGVPTVGVVPMLRDHGVPEEDALFDTAVPARGLHAVHGPSVPNGQSGPNGPNGPHGGLAKALRVAIVAAPHISNFDEFQPLLGVPGLELCWARDAGALRGADWVLLPGSKQVSGDLAWLRRQGLDAALQAHVLRGGPVLGVCGGLQMLGEWLHDPEGHDGEPVHERAGLGLLPLRTEFAATKQLRAAPVRFGAVAGAWAALAGLEVDAYEIRCGRTHLQRLTPGPAPMHGGAALARSASVAQTQPVLFDAEGAAIGWQRGQVLGITAHGLFESPAALQALFGADVATLDQRFDRVAAWVEQHLDAAPLARWLGR